MNIFAMLAKLYTSKTSDWIAEIDDVDIKPYLVQRWLCMNDGIRNHTRWLDKYVFVLPPKMYLSLAWSIIPKTEKAPFVKYIKQMKDEDEYDFLLVKVRHHMKLSDNDFEANKSRIIEAIKKDQTNWFSFYGIEKRYWKKYHLDISDIKDFGETKQEDKGLFAWG